MDFYSFNERQMSVENDGGGETSTSTDSDSEVRRGYGHDSDNNSNSSSRKKYKHHRKQSNQRGLGKTLSQTNHLTANVSTMAPSSPPELNEEFDGNVAHARKRSFDGSPTDHHAASDYDLTPKHHIRSPIIEETESGVEAELLRSRGNLLSSSFNR